MQLAKNKETQVQHSIADNSATLEEDLKKEVFSVREVIKRLNEEIKFLKYANEDLEKNSDAIEHILASKIEELKLSIVYKKKEVQHLRTQLKQSKSKVKKLEYTNAVLYSNLKKEHARFKTKQADLEKEVTEIIELKNHLFLVTHENDNFVLEDFVKKLENATLLKYLESLRTQCQEEAKQYGTGEEDIECDGASLVDSDDDNDDKSRCCEEGSMDH